MTVFSCPQCGAPVSVSPRISFHSCEYCNTTSFIDRSGVMFYYLIPFIIEKDSAEKIFARWLKNPRMAKDLHTNAKIKNFKRTLFPVYLFTRLINGEEKKFTRPARGTLIEGIENLTVPPGSMKIYDNTIDTQNAERIDPDITMEVYLRDLPVTAVSQSLLYFPIYQVEYEFNGETWHAVIDGSSGAVHATMYPVRSSLPFGTVFFIGFMAGLLGILLGIYIHPVFFILILLGIVATRFMARSIIGARASSVEG